MSVVPPAGHGTIKVTGRDGKFCACALLAARAHGTATAETAITAAIRLRFIAFLPNLSSASRPTRTLAPIIFGRNRRLLSPSRFTDSSADDRHARNHDTG